MQDEWSTVFSLGEALQRQSGITFSEPATDLLHTFVEDAPSAQEKLDHLHLAAAEFAIAAEASSGEVSVGIDSARLAALHYDCLSWRDFCKTGNLKDHAPKYSDVTVFSADAYRLSSIIGPIELLQDSPETLAQAVFQMEENYRDTDLAGQARTSQTLRWQGAIWFLQLATAKYSGYVHTDDEAVQLAIKTMYLS
ncbi:hypothetical protein [Streptomyces sp. NPDC053367]|uniref:hypothetical protein n=1 Tax=Streptomyces sp. NPDC053367 TaxID=3365700 RepID=UPI0037D52638